MDVMKKTLYTAVTAVALSLSLLPAVAVPLGRSNEAMSYLLKDPVLSSLTAGAYVGEANREFTFKGSSVVREMEASRSFGYLGISLLKWLNVYAVAGQNTAEIVNMGEADGEAIYGGGVSINLLNHFLREPIPIEDTFRLNFGLQQLTTEANLGGESLEWSEISGALTLSIINHTTGHKNYTPESIAIYAGPAFSYMRSDDIEAENTSGAVGGLEIYFTDSFAIDFRVEYFDTASGSVGVNIHF